MTVTVICRSNLQ